MRNTQVLPQNLASDLGDLRFFVENPKAIAEAHEIARKQHALTEEEKAKANEARKSIQDLTKLSVEIDAKKQALEDTKGQREKADQDLAKRKTDIEKQEADLAIRIGSHTQNEKQLVELKKQLDAQRLEQEKTDKEHLKTQQSIDEQNKALSIRLEKLKNI